MTEEENKLTFVPSPGPINGADISSMFAQIQRGLKKYEDSNSKSKGSLHHRRHAAMKMKTASTKFGTPLSLSASREKTTLFQSQLKTPARVVIDEPSSAIRSQTHHGVATAIPIFDSKCIDDLPGYNHDRRRRTAQSAASTSMLGAPPTRETEMTPCQSRLKKSPSLLQPQIKNSLQDGPASHSWGAPSHSAPATAGRSQSQQQYASTTTNWPSLDFGRTGSSLSISRSSTMGRMGGSSGMMAGSCYDPFQIPPTKPKAASLTFDKPTFGEDYFAKFRDADNKSSSSSRETGASVMPGKRKARNDDSSSSSSLLKSLGGGITTMPAVNMPSCLGFNNGPGYPYHKPTKEEVDDFVAFADKWIPTKKRRKIGNDDDDDGGSDDKSS